MFHIIRILILISYTIPSRTTLVTNFCLFVCLLVFGWVFVRGILRLVVRDFAIHAFVVVREEAFKQPKGQTQEEEEEEEEEEKGGRDEF